MSGYERCRVDRPTSARARSSLLRVVGLLGALVLVGCGTTGASSDATSDPDPGASAQEEPTTGSEATEAAEAQSHSLTLAAAVPATTAQMLYVQEWADAVEQASDGRITIEIVPDGALLNATDILRGVATGRADMAYLTNLYNPSELPLSSVSGIPFITSTPDASALAFQEIYETVPSFRQEYDDQGVRILHFYPIGGSVLGTVEPVEEVEQLEGDSIRAIGYVTNALEAIGANPVALSAAELYEALDRGTVDGYAGITFDSFSPLGVQEVAPYMADTGLGIYLTVQTVVNQDTWAELSSADQELLMESFNMEDALARFVAAESTGCDALLEAGGVANTLSDDEKSAWRSAIGDDIEAAWLDQVGADGQAILDTYVELTQKYEEQSDYQSGITACAERG